MEAELIRLISRGSGKDVPAAGRDQTRKKHLFAVLIAFMIP